MVCELPAALLIWEPSFLSCSAEVHVLPAALLFREPSLCSVKQLGRRKQLAPSSVQPLSTKTSALHWRHSPNPLSLPSDTSPSYASCRSVPSRHYVKATKILGTSLCLLLTSSSTLRQRSLPLLRTTPLRGRRHRNHLSLRRTALRHRRVASHAWPETTFDIASAK